MLKILLIFILIVYAFCKIAGFLFRLIFGLLRTNPGGFQRRGQYAKKAPDSNLNIDKAPQQRTVKNSGYEGGDYVDFEEVK